MPSQPVTDDARFRPFEEKMAAEGMSPPAIEAFRRAYGLLLRGETGLIDEASIEPAHDVPAYDVVSAFAQRGRELLPRVAMVKLNGGLGTSMGLNRAKSIIPVKNGLSFLDVIARHVLHFRERNGVALPLLFMNSTHTHDDAVHALRRYPGLPGSFPQSFLQSNVPKVLCGDLSPAAWPGRTELEWSPAGHGDIYIALPASGMLDRLLDAGYEYLFVSNADNLGAVIDSGILGYMHANSVDFIMEVARRSATDRKGGHLARRRSDGRLLLRESAQCPPGDEDACQDILRHRFFNTNNLWIRLPALRALLRRHDGLLPLHLIRNMKTVDPRDPASPPVYHLESAMGAAIALFDRAAAVAVPRTRFAPVKTTADLLAVRSDAFLLSDDYRIIPHPDRTPPPPDVMLDHRYYAFLDQLDARFPDGTPSLIDCVSLRVDGDVTFGGNVVIRGTTEIACSGRCRIDDNSMLHGRIAL